MARRSGLGRGLGALIPGSETTEKAESAAGTPKATGAAKTSRESIEVLDSAFREVPIDSIVPNRYQPRTNLDESELESLSASIKELGVLQPILVRSADNGRYELIAGERRWRASKQAKLKMVPVILKDSDDVTSLEQALVENLHRKDLNPLDEAAAYQQLIDDFSMTHEQVGKRVGRSRVAISNILRLMQLPPKVQRLVMEEKITEGHARALIGIEDASYQLQLAERAAKEQLSVRAVEEASRIRKDLEKPRTALPTGTAQKQLSKTNAASLEWTEKLAEALDTRVTIDIGGRRGRIVIEFADLDDLDRVSSTIVGASASR